MKIALIGYGKMGKEVDKIATERGHQISFRIAQENQHDIQSINQANTDVAIEFSQPESAFDNLKTLLSVPIPTVCGTTGWLEKQKDIEALALQSQTAFFYASNFSLGVNIFFKLNEILAKIMNAHPQYKVAIEEVHHTEKKDAPSGTAITLAKGILKNYSHKAAWVNHHTDKPDELEIISKREPNVPGTHSITYTSTEDFIEIKHEAFSRKGFALGAVLAAEFIQNKKGVFGMNDLIHL
ncbi:MAG: 4-hydroxy-tetrahydrodipicolinate reductase [Raineya sp.]